MLHFKLSRALEISSRRTTQINVDVAIQEGTSEYGLGMVLRDHIRNFCRALVICHAGEVGVFESETKDVPEALN